MERPEQRMAGRNFLGYKLCKQVLGTGASLLCRIKKNLQRPCEGRLDDGEFLSTICA